MLVEGEGEDPALLVSLLVDLVLEQGHEPRPEAVADL